MWHHARVLLPCVFTLCYAAVLNHPGGDAECPAGARCAPLSHCPGAAPDASADGLRRRSCGAAARELSVCCWEGPALSDLSPPFQRHRRSPSSTPPPPPMTHGNTSGTRPPAKPTPKPTAAPVSKPPPPAAKPNVASTPSSPTKATPTGNGKPQKVSPSARACEEFRRYNNNLGSTSSLSRRGRGILETKQLNVVGGERARNAEFVYMVAIGYVRGNGNSNRTDIEWGCGGSLISNRYVLTAAHCITDARKQNMRPVVLRMGTNHISPGPQREGDFSVESITLHPRHDPELKYFDLALLRTNRPVAFSDLLLPVCLATPETGVNANTTLLVAGWGAVDPAGFETTADLKKALLRFVDLDECKKSITSREGLPRGLDNSMMCAAEPNRQADTCRGDSGGPLAARGPQGDVLVGVTSFGGRPCAGSKPGVYARVQPELSWIESVVWS